MNQFLIRLTITKNYLLFKLFDRNDDVKICFIKKIETDEKKDFIKIASILSASK